MFASDLEFHRVRIITNFYQIFGTKPRGRSFHLPQFMLEGRSNQYFLFRYLTVLLQVAMKSLTRDQMQELDERAIEEYCLSLERLMENAGYQVAEFVRKKIDPDSVAVYAGKGHNGGDALSAARRLHSWGYDVEVVLATRDLEGVLRDELEILEAMNVEVSEESTSGDHDAALEGLIGYSLSGDPRPPFDSMIEEVNKYETVISIDVATGLDPAGKRFSPCVEPNYTVTMAAPFQGMNRENSGEVWVADISVPRELYREFGIEPSFESESLEKQ